MRLHVVIPHESPERKAGVPKRVVKQASLQKSQQKHQEFLPNLPSTKLYINYAIPLSSYFIFIAPLHGLALGLFTLVFNSDEERVFTAAPQQEGIVKHTNRLTLG